MSDEWEEIAEQLTRSYWDGCMGDHISVSRSELAQALREARNKALDEAAMKAKVQWLYSQRELIGDADRECELCDEISEAILALKTPHTIPHTSQSETASD